VSYEQPKGYPAFLFSLRKKGLQLRSARGSAAFGLQTFQMFSVQGQRSLQ
jgi:hypothetical protein